MSDRPFGPPREELLTDEEIVARLVALGWTEQEARDHLNRDLEDSILGKEV